MKDAKKPLIVALIILLVSAIFGGINFAFSPASPVAIPKAVTSDHYLKEVQPIFDNRCVACHSCYNSPCQMDLTAYDGVTRGASQTNVYDFPLLDANSPTRIGVDAVSEEGWRKKGFHSVLGKDPHDSILFKILHPNPDSKQAQTKFDSESSRVCVEEAFKLDSFFAANPQGRMPFGFPSLTTNELRTIQEWLVAGAAGPGPEATAMLQAPFDKKALFTISKWEDYLNEAEPKAKLRSRYLYEHLFLAHLHFDQWPNEYYRLIRAKNRSGLAEEIATVRPYDSAGEEFFYRFQKFSRTIVAKTHMPYLLDSKRLERWKQLFDRTEWKLRDGKLPPYGEATGANPFVTFQDIPAKTRYQFLLDEAYYHIMTFIKGPVCRGQTALNVINDHFWVFFIDPDFDIAVTNPEFLQKAAPLMAPPASADDQLKLFKNFRRNYWTALEQKYALYGKSKNSFAQNAIWDGDEHNPSALLTVYRHFDSAQVLQGAHGETPKTIWVLDYQVLEDIYYNLVAGYNVFGPVIHQLNTRLYMDISRIASEDMFLNFLPADARANLRKDFSQESPPRKTSLPKSIASALEEETFEIKTKDYPYLGSKVKTAFPFKSKDFKEEFVRSVIEERFSAKVRGELKPNDDTLAFGAIANQALPFVKFLPDVLLLRVEGEGSSDSLLTLIHNKAHFNVSLLLFEDERRNPKDDSLNVLPILGASYPNLYLHVGRKKLPELVKQLGQVSSSEGYQSFLKNYAISRHSKDFWTHHDWFNKKVLKLHPIEGGKIDLNRYENF